MSNSEEWAMPTRRVTKTECEWLGIRLGKPWTSRHWGDHGDLGQSPGTGGFGLVTASHLRSALSDASSVGCYTHDLGHAKPLASWC